MASAATHAVLPLVATTAGRRLQIDAGLRSHRRRFGEPAGFWLPECAYEPGLEALLAERGLELLLRRPVRPRGGPAALAPGGDARGPGGVHDRLGGDPVAVVAATAIPPIPPTPTSTASRCAAPGLGRSAGDPYDAGGGRRSAPASRRASSSRRSRAGSQVFRAERGRPGLVVFAIDTELLGHWWWEGPAWLEEVIRAAAEAGVELMTLGAGARAPPARGAGAASPRPGARARTCAPGTRRRSPTWPGRRGGWSCAWCATLRRAGSEARRAERAARELLAVQASDWAFLDCRRQAGDYPSERATEPRRGHARGHTLRGTARSAPAQPGARPEPRSAAQSRSTQPP